MYGFIPVSQFLSPKVFFSLVCLINFKMVFFNVIYQHFWSILHIHVLFTFVNNVRVYMCICHISMYNTHRNFLCPRATFLSFSLRSPLTVDGISLTRKQGSIVYASCMVPHAQSRTPFTQKTKAKKGRKENLLLLSQCSLLITGHSV